ncbi:glycoside hydrolase family 26 protein [Streptomyces albidus (ex Kaewkla and Franco 2022)]|uniref:glycoside hydrolase family 26 protein n=1 Tax=Streptomyces albidus (ex Kaewkla and Franco 2022) TaxID=722709 RepID=UPI0015EE6A12|nr:glycosyl hydrolase [Streptomyces albidus (ex Kaewkla and Franco 2022)]
MGSPKSRTFKGVCGGVVVAGLLASCSVIPVGLSEFKPQSFIRNAEKTGDRSDASSKSSSSGAAPEAAPLLPPVGAFLRSDPSGIGRIQELESWLGGTDLRVGHTYLPGDLWSNIEGQPRFLEPWARWRQAQKDRLFVLNVPMQERNEDGLPDDEVRTLLRAGASGRFDSHFRTLAERLVQQKVPDTVIVLGWEMNGLTYTHRCGPDPEAWKSYWRRIVTAMRSVPGQDFRFDFTPSRGKDAFPWTECYPGDDVVDIIGMDTYDQPYGVPFDTHVNEPYGLQDQVDFAAEHGKAVSYPEWGLFRNGDNPEYVRRMLDWFDEHKPLYQTITDYCPHGVWQCTHNANSSEAYRAAFYGRPGRPSPTPAPSPQETTPGPSAPETRPAPPALPTRHPRNDDDCFRVGDECIPFDDLLPDW